MSDKYIIKNCNVIFKNGDFYFCQSSENLAKNVYCQDCTDCVLKQIVKLCKKAIKDCDKCKGDPETDCYDCTQGGKAIQSDKIFELFCIEECE